MRSWTSAPLPTHLYCSTGHQLLELPTQTGIPPLRCWPSLDLCQQFSPGLVLSVSSNIHVGNRNLASVPGNPQRENSPFLGPVPSALLPFAALPWPSASPRVAVSALSWLHRCPPSINTYLGPHCTVQCLGRGDSTIRVHGACLQGAHPSVKSGERENGHE